MWLNVKCYAVMFGAGRSPPKAKSVKVSPKFLSPTHPLREEGSGDATATEGRNPAGRHVRSRPFDVTVSRRNRKIEKTNKNRNGPTSPYLALSRLDLLYVSDNGGFGIS